MAGSSEQSFSCLVTSLVIFLLLLVQNLQKKSVIHLIIWLFGNFHVRLLQLCLPTKIQCGFA